MDDSRKEIQMTDEPARPSRSDIKPAYRRLLCQKCGDEHRHKLTGTYQWTCQGCGASFVQNPWVTDNHPIIEPPDYEGEQRCQPMNQDNNPKNVRAAKEAATVSIAATVAASGATSSVTVSNAMVQAAFL